MGVVVVVVVVFVVVVVYLERREYALLLTSYLESRRDKAEVSRWIRGRREAFG